MPLELWSWLRLVFIRLSGLEALTTRPRPLPPPPRYDIIIVCFAILFPTNLRYPLFFSIASAEPYGPYTLRLAGDDSYPPSTPNVYSPIYACVYLIPLTPRSAPFLLIFLIHCYPGSSSVLLLLTLLLSLGFVNPCTLRTRCPPSSYLLPTRSCFLSHDRLLWVLCVGFNLF